jgi:hypothetical protein
MPGLSSSVNWYLALIIEYASNPAGDITLMLAQLDVVNLALGAAISTDEYGIPFVGTPHICFQARIWQHCLHVSVTTEQFFMRYPHIVVFTVQSSHANHVLGPCTPEL